MNTDMGTFDHTAAGQAAGEAHSGPCTEVVHAFHHNLRTPLTTLLGHAELLLEADAMPDGAERSLAAMRRAGQTIKERLADLVHSADEHDGDSGLRVHVHLESLLRGAVRDVAPSPRGSDLRLTTTGTDGLVAVVNAPLLRRGVVELLRHALTDAPSGSTVWLSCRVESAEICIEVRGEGTGPAGPGQSGVGSPTGDDATPVHGFAIATSAAAAHGGRLVVADRPHGGFSATIHLDLLSVWGR